MTKIGIHVPIDMFHMTSLYFPQNNIHVTFIQFRGFLLLFFFYIYLIEVCMNGRI